MQRQSKYHSSPTLANLNSKLIGNRGMQNSLHAKLKFGQTHYVKDTPKEKARAK